MENTEITIGLITLISLGINVVTIYRWVSDYLKREAQNDQAHHMLIGLANSVAKRVSMIVKRMDSLELQKRSNDETMILLENMWADSMSTIDNLLASAKALKPKAANRLPHDAGELLKVNAEKTSSLLNRKTAT